MAVIIYMASSGPTSFLIAAPFPMTIAPLTPDVEGISPRGLGLE